MSLPGRGLVATVSAHEALPPGGLEGRQGRATRSLVTSPRKGSTEESGARFAVAGSFGRLDLRQRGQPENIAGDELERVPAGDHRVAVLEHAEAAIHCAAREDKTELALSALPVPPVDVRLAPQEAARSPVVFINMINASPKMSNYYRQMGRCLAPTCGGRATRGHRRRATALWLGQPAARCGRRSKQDAGLRVRPTGHGRHDLLG